MMPEQKKIIAALILLVILFGGGYLGYLLLAAPRSPEESSFFSNLPVIGNRFGAAPTAPPPTGEPPLGPGAANGQAQLRQIIDREIIAPTLSADGSRLVYLLRENGHIESRDLNGDRPESVSNTTIFNIYDAIWSPKKDRVAIFYFEDGTSKQFIQNLATGTPSRFLPNGVSSVDWSPDGSSIAYFVLRTDGAELIVAGANLAQPRSVYRTPIPDLMVRWATRTAILLVSRPSGLAPSILIRVNPQTGGSELLAGGQHGLSILPVSSGQDVLAADTSADGVLGALRTLSLSSGDQKLFDGIVTLPEKCAGAKDGSAMYCGLPIEAAAAPEPDLWYRGDVSFSDDIVRYEIASGRKDLIMQHAADVDVISPFLSADEQLLFFVDKKTDTLWRVSLSR